MIPNMKQPSSQGQPAPLRVPLPCRHESKAKSDQNDADILNAVIGEQPFEIVLAERESHT